MPKVRLTSLLLVEERLLEAEHFVRRLGRQRGDIFQYELNAFLSAARSVTWLLQKEMAKVDGFSTWWADRRREMASDAAMTFFLKLRNYSQKEGRISVVGGTISGGPWRRWSHRFAGTADPVPTILLDRDVVDCCREHLAKLARIVLACTDAFPYQTCPRRALTPDGVKALQLSLSDIEETLGFPQGWTDGGEPTSQEHRIIILREHVDGLDFTTLRRLARLKARRQQSDNAGAARLGEDLLKSFVYVIERQRTQ